MYSLPELTKTNRYQSKLRFYQNLNLNPNNTSPSYSSSSSALYSSLSCLSSPRNRNSILNNIQSINNIPLLTNNNSYIVIVQTNKGIIMKFNMIMNKNKLKNKDNNTAYDYSYQQNIIYNDKEKYNVISISKII